MRFFLGILAAALAMTPLHAAGYQQGVVVSEHFLASEVGASILRQGGNAIDAAVAVGYALAVVNPCCGNIGGGGMMVIHLADGKNIFLNFREKAPANAKRQHYLDQHGNVIPGKTTNGYQAVAVPGTVLGLDTALTTYGTLSRQAVMAPAIRLAKEGYRLSTYEAAQLRDYAKDFRAEPTVAAIFLRSRHDVYTPYAAGDLLVQTNLAHTLTLIANQGPRAFYHGPIAKAIVSASQTHHGYLTLNDFANYTITTSKPLTCHYRGYTVLTAAAPSIGGKTLCYMLTKLEHTPSANIRKLDMINLMRDGFSHQFPPQQDPTSTPNDNQHYHELTDTTHYSIVDSAGNAVAVTYTLNGFFGARVIAGNTGFFLNNEMDDFSVKPAVANKFGLVQSNANLLAPEKRPFSSMTPTIVLDKGKLFLVLGSPGGPRIITTVFQTLVHLLDQGMSLQAAANAPRVHYQGLPNTVASEPNALTPSDINLLTQQGYTVTPQHTWSAIEAIWVNPETHQLEGANDIRRPDGSVVFVPADAAQHHSGT